MSQILKHAHAHTRARTDTHTCTLPPSLPLPFPPPPLPSTHTQHTFPCCPINTLAHMYTMFLKFISQKQIPLFLSFLGAAFWHSSDCSLSCDLSYDWRKLLNDPHRHNGTFCKYNVSFIECIIKRASVCEWIFSFSVFYVWIQIHPIFHLQSKTV